MATRLQRPGNPWRRGKTYLFVLLAHSLMTCSSNALLAPPLYPCLHTPVFVRRSGLVFSPGVFMFSPCQE